MSDWAGFWIALAIIYCADAYVYLQGHDSLFFMHKTAAELALQQKQISKNQDKSK